MRLSLFLLSLSLGLVGCQKSALRVSEAMSPPPARKTPDLTPNQVVSIPDRDIQTLREAREQERQRSLEELRKAQEHLAQGLQRQRTRLEDTNRDHRRSLEDRAQDIARIEADRQHLQRQAEWAKAREERDLREAERNSLRTYEQEQRQRALRQQEEDRDLQHALNNSSETHQEEKRPRYASVPSSQAVPVSISAPSSAPPAYTEGEYLRAGNLLKALNDQLRRRPTLPEMRGELMQKMNISESLANDLIDELGL